MRPTQKKKNKAKVNKVNTRYADDELYQAERDAEAYTSDVSEFSPIMVDDDEEDFSLVARERSAKHSIFFPNQRLNYTCEFYHKVLSTSSWLPDGLREIFSPEGLDLTGEVLDTAMLALQHRIVQLSGREGFGISRKCLVAFFGDPYTGCKPFHPYTGFFCLLSFY